jgi:hypothetical protein
MWLRILPESIPFTDSIVYRSSCQLLVSIFGGVNKADKDVNTQFTSPVAFCKQNTTPLKTVKINIMLTKYLKKYINVMQLFSCVRV